MEPSLQPQHAQRWHQAAAAACVTAAAAAKPDASAAADGRSDWRRWGSWPDGRCWWRAGSSGAARAVQRSPSQSKTSPPAATADVEVAQHARAAAADIADFEEKSSTDGRLYQTETGQWYFLLFPFIWLCIFSVIASLLFSRASIVWDVYKFGLRTLFP